MDFTKTSVLPFFDNVVVYLEDVLPEHSKVSKQVVIYCEPVGVKSNNFGGISEYKVIRIFDIVEYLKGDKSDSTCKEVTYTSTDIPNNLKDWLDNYYRLQNF